MMLLVSLLFLCSTVVNTSWINLNRVRTLSDEIDHTVAACQEDHLYLQCRNRYNKIVIKDVFYGRDNLFTCTSKIFNATNLCPVPTPRNIIEKVHVMCNNENKCKVPVTTAFLQKNDEEICYNIRKYLKVKYACHQNPQVHMVCNDGCSSSCWPMCQQSCCQPHPTSFVAVQCSGGCSSSCAPLCQPTCCKTNSPMLQISPSMPSSCPGTCSGGCLPLCDPTCCMMHQTQNTNLLQSLPQNPSCTPPCANRCAPLCSPSCCGLHQIPPPMSCENGCPSQCFPACQPNCCMANAMQLHIPPSLGTPACPFGCPSRCAPLCKTSCCQASPATITPLFSSCTQGCPSSCYPLCQPSCCQQGYNGMIQNQMISPYSNYCSPACFQNVNFCQASCPSKCCLSKRRELMYNQETPIDLKEIQQRRTYQEMLTKFRRKQLQRYLYG